MFNPSSDPYQALDFVLGPIREVLATRERSFEEILIRLGILECRYMETLPRAVKIDWKASISTDFTLLELISDKDAKQVAFELTEIDLRRFRKLSVGDFLIDKGERRQEIGRQWQNLVEDTQACATVSRGLGSNLNNIVHVGGFSMFTHPCCLVKLTCSIVFVSNEKLYFGHCGFVRPRSCRTYQPGLKLFMASR